MNDLEQLRSLVEEQGKIIGALRERTDELTRRHVVYNALVTCLLLSSPHPERLQRDLGVAIDESRRAAGRMSDAELLAFDEMAQPFVETAEEAKKGLSAFAAVSAAVEAMFIFADAVCYVLPEARRNALLGQLAENADARFDGSPDPSMRYTASMLAAMREFINGSVENAAKILETQQPLG
ncbi:hypothetical protein [Trinickia soli]|uniref:hypothetical protein n=1 Tax=Trinickia soli TaxID=380675 RepID=UPI0011AF2630|nr:hypothetical protein [Trinickia soli]CAB3688304.1 hypothetical protein LMG24076_02794 [Trinickia soli]